MKRTLFAVAGAILALPMLANAAAIPLVNTGAGAGPVPAHGDIDPNFTISGPVSGQAKVIANYGVYPLNGNWLGEDGISHWISPSADTTGVVGEYTFATTFDLTGLNPSTASITGRWAADNTGEIWLNGVDTGVSIDDEGFRDWSEFTLESGFVEGVNTLEFRIDNLHDQSPTGLRVELQGGADAGGTQTPEPSTLLAFGLMFGAAACYRRRSLRTVAAV